MCKLIQQSCSCHGPFPKPIHYCVIRLRLVLFFWLLFAISLWCWVISLHWKASLTLTVACICFFIFLQFILFSIILHFSFHISCLHPTLRCRPLTIVWSSCRMQDCTRFLSTFVSTLISTILWLKVVWIEESVRMKKCCIVWFLRNELYAVLFEWGQIPVLIQASFNVRFRLHCRFVFSRTLCVIWLKSLISCFIVHNGLICTETTLFLQVFGSCLRFLNRRELSRSLNICESISPSHFGESRSLTSL